MRKILFLIVSTIAAANISAWLVKQDTFHGELLRDTIAFTMLVICLTGIAFFTYDKIEEIERKQAKKRDNELLFLEDEIRKEIEKKETA